MTSMFEPEGDKTRSFASTDEAVYAYQAGYLPIREKINVRLNPNEKVTETTVGRILFNRILPEGMPYKNDLLGKKQLAEITQSSIDKFGFEVTAQLLDRIKALGYKYITKSGFSYGVGDLPTIAEKDDIMEEAAGRVKIIEEQYKDGLLTKRERYTQIIKVWSDIQDRIKNLSKSALNKEGSVAAMIDSGARGSIVQLMQVVGMKGLVTNPSGGIIELPIKSSFRQGLDVLEYFISSHGTRKGLTDTALKTANPGP